MIFPKGYSLIILLLFSCKDIPARKPLSIKSSGSLEWSVQRNKILLEKEMETFKQIIKTDSLDGFQKSPDGFLYRYIYQDTLSVPVSKGDRVKVSFEVRDPDMKLLYSNADKGVYSFLYQKEDILFKGIRYALGMMHKGDTLQAFFPSSLAYGYHGDEDRIGSNVALFCEIVLADVIKKNN